MRGMLGVAAVMFAGAMTLVAPVGGAAGKGEIERISARDLARVLDDHGIETAQPTPSGGRPRLIARLDGVTFTIEMDRCDGRTEPSCAQLVWRAAWCNDGTVTAARLAGWNGTMAPARAYMDEEEDPVVELGLSLAGGVTRRALDAFVQRWDAVLLSFAGLLENGPASDAPAQGEGPGA